MMGHVTIGLEAPNFILYILSAFGLIIAQASAKPSPIPSRRPMVLAQILQGVFSYEVF